MGALLLVLFGVLVVQAQDTPLGQAGTSRPYRVSGDVSAPRVTYKVEPSYSDEARIARLEGTVLLYIVVGEDGSPHDLRVLRPLGLGLDEQAVDTVRMWRFQPGIKEGKPVPVQATIEVNFRLLDLPGAWHLSGAAFKLAPGVARPQVVRAGSPDPLNGSERATVTISLDIDENGTPTNVRAEKSSSPMWELEIVRQVSQGWIFKPATKDGKPVAVHATLDFAR